MAENMHMTPEMLEEKFPQIKDIINTAMESYRKGEKACKNMYNVLLLDDYFEYFIILSALGYLFGLFLHSFSAVKFKYFIDEKYISPYLIIIFIGLIGFILNIILLLISTYIPCGKSTYSVNFCHTTKYENNDENLDDFKVNNYYFDNFLAYIDRLNDAFHTHIPKKDNIKYGKDVRKPKDGILEILFSLTILPILGFFKTTFDLFIIKELGVFHLLFPEVIYQFLQDLIIILYKKRKGIIDKTQITQFIVIGITNFFAIIGFTIYLELIKLKFCGFDYNTKDNIIQRSMLESGDINNDFRLSDINDEEDNENENSVDD